MNIERSSSLSPHIIDKVVSVQPKKDHTVLDKMVRRTNPPHKSSTYQELEVNEGEHVVTSLFPSFSPPYLVNVRLVRNSDSHNIPYSTITGVSLVSLMRLGMLEFYRERAFVQFLQLPLFEDMATWNILLTGSSLVYIDFDTKTMTFDKVIPSAFRVMEVLMNYKRTVQDFGKCSTKAKVLYGLPYVGDCVGGTSSVSKYTSKDEENGGYVTSRQSLARGLKCEGFYGWNGFLRIILQLFL